MTATRRSSSRLSGLKGVQPSSPQSSPKKKKKKSASATCSPELDENAPNLAGATARRLTTRTRTAKQNLVKEEEEEIDNDVMEEADAADDNGNDEEDDDDVEQETYIFNGVTYATYQEMVDAKRFRNQQVLAASGLLKAAAGIRKKPSSSTVPTAGNKKKRRSSCSNSNSTTTASAAAATSRRRTSKRLAGIESDGTFVDDERGGRFSIASNSNSGGGASTAFTIATTTTTDMNVNNNSDRRGRRINDGSDLSLEQAVQLVAPFKWLQENSVEQAQTLMRDMLLLPQQQTRQASVAPVSVSSSWTRQEMRQQLQERSSMSDCNIVVAKVVPDRIYSITTHPSSHHLVVCAGDKQGHVGIWNVNAGASLSSSSSTSPIAATNGGSAHNEETDNCCKTNKDSPTTLTLSALESNIHKSSSSGGGSSNGGFHLFRPHASTTACLEWTRQGTALFSMSYDGTCRLFDVAAERFQQVFDSSCISSGRSSKCGISEELDYFNDSAFWFQFACLDHRSEECFFLSTSIGTAMHVDMRASGKQRLTFHEEWSEKKINSLR
jgi:hypothetical protein